MLFYGRLIACVVKLTLKIRLDVLKVFFGEVKTWEKPPLEWKKVRRKTKKTVFNVLCATTCVVEHD